MKLIEELLTALDSLVGIYVSDFISPEDVTGKTNFHDITSMLLDDGAFDEEFIYWDDAVEYLSKNDAGFDESLNIASKYGYEAKDLNSCILASLHATEKNKEEWYKMEEQVNELLLDFFNK